MQDQFEVGSRCVTRNAGDQHDEQSLLKVGEESIMVAQKVPMKDGIRNIRALPEIGWRGGTWIEFEIEDGNNMKSTKDARRKN